MDILLIFYSVLLTALLYFEGVSSFQAGDLSLSPPLPVLGDDDFTLQCTITLIPNVEQLQGVTLKRKRTGDSGFFDILRIPPPTLSTANITFDDPSLQARTVVMRPDTSPSTSVTVTFSSTHCSDIGEYKIVIAYYSGGNFNEEKTADVKVKVYGTIAGADYGITSVTPGYDVTENTNVTVTCKADVGAEPQGQLEWYYYKGLNTGTAYPISSYASKEALETVRECSHAQVSTLTLPMNESLNNIVIRCTLQQDVSTPEGNGYNQTQRLFSVTYSARRTTISQEPYRPAYSEGTETLTLTCSSDGNPTPSYTWLLPDGTEVTGATYQLQNLQLNDTGNYTCMAKNGVPNENFTDTKVLELSVDKTTTPAPTTSTSASTTPKQTGGGTTQASTDDDPDNTTTIIIAVCVPVAVIIIVVIIVICYCSRKNKKKEIEEPPEKPRNNQDLNFSGYRPGLTTSTDSLKNSGNNLNTSFNSFESSDSKPRNEDGLNYVDLQFDDRPRSRRPIQVYDNGTSTQYADIAMPRV